MGFSVLRGRHGKIRFEELIQHLNIRKTAFHGNIDDFFIGGGQEFDGFLHSQTVDVSAHRGARIAAELMGKMIDAKTGGARRVFQGNFFREMLRDKVPRLDDRGREEALLLAKLQINIREQVVNAHGKIREQFFVLEGMSLSAALHGFGVFLQKRVNGVQLFDKRGGTEIGEYVFRTADERFVKFGQRGAVAVQKIEVPARVSRFEMMGQIAVYKDQISRTQLVSASQIGERGAPAHGIIEEIGIVSLSVQAVGAAHDFVPRHIHHVAQGIAAAFARVLIGTSPRLKVFLNVGFEFHIERQDNIVF